MHYAEPPLLLEDLIDDVQLVVDLFERNAPYTPLGGWFRPDNADGDALSPMWFQKDWVHADFVAEGSELFLHNERVIEASREFYDAEVVLPHSIYVNLMVAMAESGPAHTDNPLFRGRDRTNTPMMLLRSMLWSGLFERWVIPQATSIWWLNDAEGGGLKFWPNGPDQEPEEHVGAMANTALVGDNHGMFHQVQPVGPFDKGTQLVNADAELSPCNDGSGDWAVRHNDEEYFRAPFTSYRASVLWKADIYKTEAERRELEKDQLSFAQVIEIFNNDLADKGADLRLDMDSITDPALPGELADFYPEAVPINAGISIFEV